MFVISLNKALALKRERVKERQRVSESERNSSSNFQEKKLASDQDQNADHLKYIYRAVNVSALFCNSLT